MISLSQWFCYFDWMWLSLIWNCDVVLLLPFIHANRKQFVELFSLCRILGWIHEIFVRRSRHDCKIASRLINWWALIILHPYKQTKQSLPIDLSLKQIKSFFFFQFSKRLIQPLVLCGNFGWDKDLSKLCVALYRDVCAPRTHEETLNKNTTITL